MNLKKKTKKAGVVIGTSVIIVIIMFGAMKTLLQEPVTAQQKYPAEHLFVDATYLLKTQETNESVEVVCTPYLTNIWEKESGNIHVIGYVLETHNNLAVFKNRVEVGKIDRNATVEIEIPLLLSNNSYRVELLFFENNKLVIKGQLTISAYPNYYYDEISHEKSVGWQLENTQPLYDAVH